MMLLSVFIQHLILVTNSLDSIMHENENERITQNYSSSISTIALKSESKFVTNSIFNVPVKGKHPVKLNMKQGLIMNQVLNFYALDDAENSLCINHSLEFKDALRSFEPWALKMFDSSSKLQSGVLAGNLIEFGSFKQCIYIQADTPSGVVKGKQCTLKITPPESLIKKILAFRNVSEKRFEMLLPVIQDIGVYWSVCIPEACTIADALKHFSKTVKVIGEGLNLNVTLNEMDCYSLIDEPIFTWKQYIVISLFFGIIGISLLCTLIDSCNKKEGKKPFLIDIFSIYNNAKYVFSYNLNDPSGLTNLHGIRFLSIAYVVMGHRYLMALFVPAVNSLDLLEWLLKYSSTIIIGATVSVDSFFMLGGFLITYHTFCALALTNGKFNWFLFYLYRFMRLTPPLAFAVLVHTTLVQFIGYGPLWKKMSAVVQKPCQYFWWSTLLHIQNYVNPKHICILPTWYLTNDFFYYMFSPLLIYPLWRWRLVGWINLLVFYVISVMINFYFAWINKYGAGMLVTTRFTHTKHFSRYYIAPHVRASTYILGIALGAIVYKTKDVKIKLHPVTVAVGWIWSSALMLVTILGNLQFQLEDHSYNRLESTIFLSMSRSAWTVGLMWIVWACIYGYGGPVNYFLSHPIFQVLGKVTYSIFLWHITLQYLDNGALKLPTYFSDFYILYKFIGDICVITFVSIFYTIFFECPCHRLIKHLKFQDTRITNKSQ